MVAALLVLVLLGGLAEVVAGEWSLGPIARQGIFVVEASKSKHEVLREGLVARGWRESKRGGSFGFKWSTKAEEPPNSRAVLNHFRNFKEFCSKDGLLASLRESGSSTAAWFPRCFLSSEWDQIARDAANTALRCGPEVLDGLESEVGEGQPFDCGSGNGRLWIVKPARGTRGVGIQMFDDVVKMRVFLESRPSDLFVVQKLFVLVTSLKPLVVFCSRDSYVRFSSVPYNGSNVDDLFVHLTNHQVQKLFPHNETREKEDLSRGIHHNQWSLESFADHIGREAWENIVFPRIRHLVRRVLSSWPKRGENHRDNSFELLGLDIMLDSEMRPYLLEINADPGLHLLTEVVNVHHRRAVEGLLRVVLDERDLWQKGAECGTEMGEGVCSETIYIDPFEMVLKIP